MPESPETDLEALKVVVKEKVLAFSGMDDSSIKFEIQPIAFGLSAVMTTFVTPEREGATDKLEEDLLAIQEVASLEVTDVRRALG